NRRQQQEEHQQTPHAVHDGVHVGHGDRLFGVVFHRATRLGTGIRFTCLSRVSMASEAQAWNMRCSLPRSTDCSTRAMAAQTSEMNVASKATPNPWVMSPMTRCFSCEENSPSA